jgi:hypothetical protein
MKLPVFIISKLTAKNLIISGIPFASVPEYELAAV